MKLKNLFILALIINVGCVSYKELQPIPEINPSEGKFQPLKNKGENFILEKGDKYIIKFPRPSQNDFYLILMGFKKPIIYAFLENYIEAETETVLTRSFGFREGGAKKIKDETPSNDTLSTYAIDSMSTFYVWKIDTVRSDVELNMQYRYVFQWRYIFENDYQRFLGMFNNNIVDKTIFNSINPAYDVNKIEYDKLIGYTSNKKDRLKDLKKELVKIEKVFPQNIKQSNDTAYTTYIELCNNVDEEINFQEKYLDLLIVLKKEKDTKGDIRAFLKQAPDFTLFMNKITAYPLPIQEKVRQIFTERLKEVVPFYESALRMSDLNAIGPYPELENALALYKACDMLIPIEYGYLVDFFKKFVPERDALRIAEGNLADVDALTDNVSDRLIDSFYKTILTILEQTRSIIPVSEVRQVEKYGRFKCAIILEQKITSIAKYVDILIEQIASMQLLDSKYRDINAMFERTPTWPSDLFYVKIVGLTEEIKKAEPKSIPHRVEPYSDSKISVWLNRRMMNILKNVNEFQPKYQKASVIVPQINSLRNSGNYRSIIRLLNANRSLGFLLMQYPDVDSMSLSTQVDVISKLIENNEWRNAEVRLEELFNDKDYLNSSFLEIKNKSVKNLENDLFAKIYQLSRNAADNFVKNNENVFNNVQALYKDSAFLPVYNLNFSSTSEKDLISKKKQIENYLDEVRRIKFPEIAIKTLYRELTKNIKDYGVEKARAIVEHGKHYKGNDKQVRGLIDECDYSVAKVLSKPGEYRKLFALPSTTNLRGINEYVIRINLKIPSEAEFPVFDVNLTVPPEVVKSDPKYSWYDEITINKKIIKSEGRFHITAPTAANNYESQISPVQIDKSTNNILEIKFKYEGFRVFEVSVMAQKPIIRKN